MTETGGAEGLAAGAVLPAAFCAGALRANRVARPTAVTALRPRQEPVKKPLPDRGTTGRSGKRKIIIQNG